LGVEMNPSRGDSLVEGLGFSGLGVEMNPSRGDSLFSEPSTLLLSGQVIEASGLTLNPESSTLLFSRQVIEASGLTPVDLVSSDPYVLVSCGDSVCQTPAVMQNCDPEWDNQIFCFKTEKEDAIVYIDVFDYNRLGSSRHSRKVSNLN
jgi:hypothetical protein